MSLTQTIAAFQRQFHDAIASGVSAIHETGSWQAFGAVILAAFLYGILHAAGPGHGKIVIGSYMLADDTTLRNGLVITALSSLLQAVTAITLVLVLYFILGLARDKTEYAAAWFECASFGLVALVGAVLLVKGLRRLDLSAHARGGPCGCGHPHGPAPTPGMGWKTMAGMVFSIGIRPCSGALVLMFFACVIGEIGAGIAAVFAMALGTAITVGAIALAAAGSKHGILKLVGASDTLSRHAGPVLQILGGAAIMILAGLFCYAAMPQGKSIAPYNHPLTAHPKV